MLDQRIKRSLQEKADSLPDFTQDMGDFITNEIILSRRESFGGCTNEILGPQGTGKTSLMLSYACSIMESYPDEIIIWRDSYQSQCQFNRLKHWEIFAESNDKGSVDLQFRNIYEDSFVDIPITFFSSFKDLENKMSPGQLNVVYVSDQIVGYIRLINYFRRTRGWQAIFVDEYEDIAPLNCSGAKNELIGALGSEMKNIRKGLVSLFCNTQSKSQIDWRVRSTFMVETYLSGAKKDKSSSVYQNAINSLEKGAAWVSWEGKFGRINFDGFTPRKPILDVDDLNHTSRLDEILKKFE